MRTIMLAGAAALAFAVTPAIAQTAQTTTTHQHGAMNETQMGMYNSWPADRRAQFDSWPENYRSYYWTLTPAQQQGWWVLTDDQRKRVHDMTPEQRTQAWTAISAQMAGGTPSATASTTSATTTATTTGTGNIRWVSNGMVQAVSADAPPADPPICTPNQQDNCINAWEAGRRGANVTRPLDHWPGRPASEM